MLLSAAQCVLILAALSTASPTSSNYVLHEKRSAFASPSKSLQGRSKLGARHVLPVRIGLTQRGLEEMGTTG